ncbi:uncharacterized protein METZ01_LOCUS47723 [marine metagenome]|uniref:Lactam utilization protein LamB n=1 Tax=marine metagenome TaxID=408172 RepID=A0A381RUW6_9ZZZZ
MFNIYNASFLITSTCAKLILIEMHYFFSSVESLDFNKCSNLNLLKIDQFNILKKIKNMDYKNQITIDLNADLGEFQTDTQYLYELQILNHVSSCNIACGGHTGNDESMKKIIVACQKNKVSIGAHPSYPDPMGFGRRSIEINESRLKESLIHQINKLVALSKELNTKPTHVKAHGALYHDVSNSKDVATLFVDVINQIDPNLYILGLPGSAIESVVEEHGMRFICEAFLDRRYSDSGFLLNRSQQGAILENVSECCEQAVNIVCNNKVQTETGGLINITAETLCLHSDSPNALKTAARVRSELEKINITIQSFVV